MLLNCLLISEILYFKDLDMNFPESVDIASIVVSVCNGVTCPY
jgi:hypothetical protein